VSMGVNALNKRALARYTSGLPLGFDELVLDLLAAGTPPDEYAFDGYWLDIGRPDDYDRANAEFDLVVRPALLKGA
jgi:NDP-sugar pyrophosphorylase family protein